VTRNQRIQFFVQLSNLISITPPGMFDVHLSGRQRASCAMSLPEVGSLVTCFLGPGRSTCSQIVVQDDSITRFARPEVVECIVDPAQWEVLGSGGDAVPGAELEHGGDGRR
jgi:hypothetical protein